MKQGRQFQTKNVRKGRVEGFSVDDTALTVVRDLLNESAQNTPTPSLAREHLIENLHLIQDAFGGISAKHLGALAHLMKLSPAEVFEVASFYAHFNVDANDGTGHPAPLIVRVCESPSCRMAGADALRTALQSALQEGVHIVAQPCMGACDHAPMVMVGRNRLNAATVENVRDTLPHNRTRAQTPNFQSLDAYLDQGGYKTFTACQTGARTRPEVRGELQTAQLKGLGGAGFPVARKWAFFDKAAKPRVLAVNADEGEPGTFKDRHLLETSPHRVIEGALLAAWAIEAEDIYIYLRDEYAHIHAFLNDELQKMIDRGLNGKINLHLRRGAGSYVCGEESAMLESIEGKRGLPRNRPPFPAQSGLFGRPTLVHNVETLYWTHAILQNGAQAYLDQGRPHFYSVSGRVREPGVKLAPSDITVRELIETHAGGMATGHTFKAYMPGGASGGILPAHLGDVPLAFGALEQHGAFIGSSAVIILSQHDSIPEMVEQCLHFFAEESCGQCTPCRVGIVKMLDLLHANTPNTPLAHELADIMRDGSICGLGQAAPNALLCAYRYFADEMTAPTGKGAEK